MSVSTIQQNLIPNEPELKDLFDLWRKEILLDFNCHHIGTIQSFNASNQTASVTINYKQTNFNFNETTGIYDPVLMDYPILAEAPVLVLGGGSGSLTFPIRVGDECLILFNDRDLDNWFVGGTGSPNGTARLHSYADAIVLVGLRSLPNSLASYDSTRVVIQNGTTSIGLGASLIQIQNATQNLNSILQNLISTLSSLMTTPTIPGTPATLDPSVIAQLTVIATDLSELLE